MENVIKSFKGFDKDLKCRGFQFEVGKEYEEQGVKVCERGFHACESPLQVFNYYPPATSRYCEVEQSGEIDREGNKTASTKIKIGAEIGIPGLVKAHIEYVKSRCTNEHTDPKMANAGDRGVANAGDRGVATAGDSGVANAGDEGVANAGDRGVASAGDSGVASAGDSGVATAGYRGVASAGYRGVASAGDSGVATSGSYGVATSGSYGVATSRGSASVGADGAALVRGNGCRIRGGLGAILVIAEERNDSYAINHWKAVVVDGETVKADTWYRLIDGELVEETDGQK